MNKLKRPEGHFVYENFTGTKREYDFWKKLSKFFKRKIKE